MLKKIVVSMFLFSLFVNAQEVEVSVEDKYNACSESYDQCLTKCEEANTNVEECGTSCENEFYKCNEKVDKELESLTTKEN